jgi:hypothetical protein
MNQQNEKCRQISGNFDCYADAAVLRGAHRSMDHIQGFTQSHWMPLLVECPAATMADEFEQNTQNTNKTQLLASNYGTFLALVVVCESSYPKMDPLLSSLMQQAA